MIGWAKDMGIADSGVIFICKKCGERYQMTPTNFMKLDANNKSFKYMKRLSLKSKWEMDN